MFHYKKNHPTSKQNGPIKENGSLVIRTRFIHSFDVCECKINLRVKDWLRFFKVLLCSKGKGNHVDNERELGQGGDGIEQVEGVALVAGDVNSRARFHDTNQESGAEVIEDQKERVAIYIDDQTDDESEDAEEQWYFSDDDSKSLPSIFGSDTEDEI